MRYMGSKARYVKDILPIILANRTPEQTYVEPFVGGCHVIEHVTGPRIGSDSHKYLVALFREVASGWQPPTDVTREMYNMVRDNPDQYPDHVVGFVGFGCSYGGKWWGGYARGGMTGGKPRNYASESARSLLKQSKGLHGVDLRCSSYLDLIIPDKSLIYCDPPYFKTTKYKGSFNHEEFWEWCLAKVDEGHEVFVSEYTAPREWVPVWSKSTTNTLDKAAKIGIEKLFTIKES